jgi:hypothetical protein
VGAIAACGSGSNAASGFDNGAGTAADGGYVPGDGETPTFDATAGEGGGESAAPVPPTVTFVHASPSLNDARLCWTSPLPGDAGATLTSVPPFPSGAPMPASNFPGLPVGGAVQLSSATALALASLAAPVDIYAIDAEVLAREVGTTSPGSCEAVVCLQNSSQNPTAPCLRPNKDYWHVGTLPRYAIATSGPTIVALTGCLGTALDPAAGTARCGSDWDAVTGNLHVEVIRVASSSGSATDDGAAPALDGSVLSVQSALLSPALASSLADAGAVRLSFGAVMDASPLATLVTEDDVEPRRPAGLSIGTDLATFGQIGFGVDTVGAEAGAPPYFWASLAQAQSLVDPTVDPRVYFGTGATYVALVVGDPGAPSPFAAGDASYDGRGLHVLVLSSLPSN